MTPQPAMTPSRWSSAIAILRRRQAEADAEDRALLRRTPGGSAESPRGDVPSDATDGNAASSNARVPERLLALWKQILGG